MAQTGIAVPSMSHCDQAITQFMTTYNIPGATFAIAKAGKLVYMRSFGTADLAETEVTQPHHMFRIASLSKPITSIAIMKLVEDGDLLLSDKAFGPQGVLANHPYLSTVQPADQRIYDITVQQLLEHSAGWNRNTNCTPNPTTPYSVKLSGCDPISFPLHVTQTLGESNPVTEPMLIRFLMEKGLDFTPGTQYQYSNIGYLVLGEIIEAVSGKSYEDYVKEDILAPIGICDMHIGKNLLADKRIREAEYHGNGFNINSLYGDGSMVPWEYGGWNLEAMDAHGGWIATTRDLVRLLLAVDGFSTKPDILSAATIQTMTTPGANSPFYAKGWSVNNANHWWHTGGLDGTASLMVRTNSGYTWAAILNRRVIGNGGNAFWSAFDNLPWSCVMQTNNFPTHDLLDVPSLNSSALNATPVSESDLGLSWIPGNGVGRVLVAREGSPVNKFPLDGVQYTGNAVFGQGEDLGDGNVVVYAGSASSTVLTGLDPEKTYHFSLYEYQKYANTGNHALYQLCDAPVLSATTASSSVGKDLDQWGIRFYPNPTSGILHIEMEDPILCERIVLTNLHGQVLRSEPLQGQYTTMSLLELPAQMYVVAFYDRQGKLMARTRLVVQ